MRRHLNRIGLSLLMTVGVISWSQQQSQSFSQPQPLFVSMAQTATDNSPSNLAQIGVATTQIAQNVLEIAQAQEDTAMNTLFEVAQLEVAQP